MEKVELRPAVAWDCPACERENFGRVIVREFDQATEAQMRAEAGVEPWEDGNFIGAPERVTCDGCDRSFDVEFGTCDFDEDGNEFDPTR